MNREILQFFLNWGNRENKMRKEGKKYVLGKQGKMEGRRNGGDAIGLGRFKPNVFII